MAIRVQCMCGELIDAWERMAGREVRCPRCSRLVLVPGPAGQVKPATVFSLAVLAGIAITLGILLLPNWLQKLKGRGPERTLLCARNLQAIGRAIEDYAVDHGGWMPSSWDNTFALIEPYLAPQQSRGPDAVWRCPRDPTSADADNHCSYAVNADETDGGEHNQNRFHADQDFVQSGRASDDRRADFYPGPFAHRVHNGGERQAPVRREWLPDDTILMVECWSPRNTLDLDQPKKANREAPGEGTRSCLAIRDYGTWRKPKFDRRECLIDAGSFLFLKRYEGEKIPVNRMYHGGRLHVLYADGRVKLVSIKQLIKAPSGLSPQDLRRWLLDDSPWTRPGDRPRPSR